MSIGWQPHAPHFQIYYEDRSKIDYHSKKKYEMYISIV